jgi:hypothetical protein
VDRFRLKIGQPGHNLNRNFKEKPGKNPGLIIYSGNKNPDHEAYSLPVRA